MYLNHCGMHSGDYPRVLEVPFSSSRKMMLLVLRGCCAVAGCSCRRLQHAAHWRLRLTVSKVKGAELCPGGMPLPAGSFAKARAFKSH